MKTFSLNSVELLEYQPNRHPFLMIDYVTKVKPGVFAEGYKNLTNNEWYFPIHFPNNPNVPGVLQLEALAQMLTVAITTLPGNKGKITHALSHTVRFRKEVLPGQKFVLKTKVDSWKRGICKGYGQGIVDGEIACEATMAITIPEILEQYLPKNKA
ncbi:MAG TPA: beta-hydroxyacyl-ACP dehydratase [Candidatus Pelagibacter sp.]|nr:beta-hydroxyacyl-ACP dehydratase [Candidatus Pelagibacter sp.]